jgi:hypothetical protein
MSGRTFAAILLVIVLGIGAAALGLTAYNAGVSAGLAQNVVDSGASVVVAPGYPGGPYVGYGWGHGFGFFWFFGAILFFFIVLGLIRAAFGWGRGWGRGYGPGGWGPGSGRGEHRQEWHDRVREFHDELHRGDASGGSPPPRT